MKARLLSGLVLLVLLAACSHRQVYEGLRERERNLCAQGPEAQYEECLQRAAMSYEEYLDRTGG